MNTHGKLSFAAVAATLLLLAVSCVTEEVYTPQAAENGTVPVSFTSVSVGTRAGTTTLGSLKTGAGFRVFAWETGTVEWDAYNDESRPANPNFMPLTAGNGVSVTWSANNKWNYTPTKYWPGKISGADYGKLTFFAYAPAKGDETGVTGVTTTADATPKLAFTTPATAASQVDLTADALYNQDYTTNDGNVPFTLKHLLSKIGFEAQLSAQYAGVTAVTLDELTIHYTSDKIKSAGVYTFPDANDADGAWVLGSTYMAGDDKIVTTAVALSTNPAEATSLNQSGDNYLMLLPQATGEGDLTVSIKYSVTETEQEEAEKYECTTLLPALVWEQGKQHTYTFRFLRNEVFIVTNVVPWDEDEPADAPIYKELSAFSNAANSDKNSAIDWLTYNSAAAGDDAVLFIRLPQGTETVSFAAGTDVGLAGVTLAHTGDDPDEWTSAKNVTIDGGGRTVDLQGSPSGSPLITVGKGVTLTLTNIVFKGLKNGAEGDNANNSASLILVDGGTLILGEGAVLSDNHNVGGAGTGGGVCMKDGTFLMKGGVISGNKAVGSSEGSGYGGGVYVTDGTFTVTGGVIYGSSGESGLVNIAGANGGAVYVKGGAVVIYDETVCRYCHQHHHRPARQLRPHRRPPDKPPVPIR